MMQNEQSSGNNISIYLRPNKQDIRRLKYIKYQQQIYIYNCFVDRTCTATKIGPITFF